MAADLSPIGAKARLRCPGCQAALAHAMFRRLIAEGRTIEIIQCPKCHAIICGNSVMRRREPRSCRYPVR